MKVLNSIWFHSLGGPAIGIVLYNNGVEDKAVIGLGFPANTQSQDESRIVRLGAKFPLEAAKELMR